MVVNEMTEKECREVLERAPIGRLGCALSDQPYIVPVHFAYEPDYIYVFSTHGQKVEWMRQNPKVCMQVDEIADPSNWVSVIANGLYQELPEVQCRDEREHARQLLQARHNWWANALAERRITLGDSSIEPLFFRIKIQSMTGLRSLSGDEQARTGTGRSPDHTYVSSSER
jgi:nitroimidazol reductase NimA-like FMN-containing flavoprotein (pyridoxamine 5'-phosphate oxidase superfamily)